MKNGDPIFFLYWIRKKSSGKNYYSHHAQSLRPASSVFSPRGQSHGCRVDSIEQMEIVGTGATEPILYTAYNQNIAHSNIPLKTNIAIVIANSPLFTVGNTFPMVTPPIAFEK